MSLQLFKFSIQEYNEIRKYLVNNHFILLTVTLNEQCVEHEKTFPLI